MFFDRTLLQTTSTILSHSHESRLAAARAWPASGKQARARGSKRPVTYQAINVYFLAETKIAITRR